MSNVYQVLIFMNLIRATHSLYLLHKYLLLLTFSVYMIGRHPEEKVLLYMVTDPGITTVVSVCLLNSTKRIKRESQVWQLLIDVCMVTHLAENSYFPVRPASSRVSLLISILRLKLVLTYEIPPKFRGGVHLFTVRRNVL